jgi:hypothetical protein
MTEPRNLKAEAEALLRSGEFAPGEDRALYQYMILHKYRRRVGRRREELIARWQAEAAQAPGVDYARGEGPGFG